MRRHSVGTIVVLLIVGATIVFDIALGIYGAMIFPLEEALIIVAAAIFIVVVVTHELIVFWKDSAE